MVMWCVKLCNRNVLDAFLTRFHTDACYIILVVKIKDSQGGVTCGYFLLELFSKCLLFLLVPYLFSILLFHTTEMKSVKIKVSYARLISLK